MLNLILGFITLISFENIELKPTKVEVKESTIVWTATKVVGGGHTGTIKLASADLQLVGDKIKGGSFSIDMSTIDCTDLDGGMEDKLVGHLKSADFFAVDEFNTADFKISKTENNDDGSINITGDITIKGKTETISFPATVTTTDDNITVVAKITLNRTNFDVRYGSNSFFDNLGDKAISDEFTLDVTLVSSK